jgi:5-amino-6-(5-phosphoribosylamino)uracil reductase
MELINIMAASLDGHIGQNPDETDQERLAVGFLSEEDHQNVEQQLRSADAVILGAQSMRLSPGPWIPANASLTSFKTKWIVVTASGLDLSHPFWQEARVPRYLASTNESLRDTCEQNQIGFLGLPGTSEVAWAKNLYQSLADLGCQRVLLFGGGHINRWFYEADLVDELHLTLCPFVVANPDAPRLVANSLSVPKKFWLVSFEAHKNHVILRYRTSKH